MWYCVEIKGNFLGRIHTAAPELVAAVVKAGQHCEIVGNLCRIF